MSTEASDAAEKSNEPKAATIAELKAACKGASSDFILGQAEKGATVQQALAAHVEKMAAEKEELAKENASLKSAAAEPKEKKRGVAPIASGKGEEESASNEPWAELGANEFMHVEVANRVAKGQPRERAVKGVFAAYPGLQEAMVAEANERRSR